MANQRRGSDMQPQKRVPLSRASSSSSRQSMMDSEVLPSSLVQIAPILRVANEVEHINPRVAYLCRFYAFEKCHRVDPTSSGRGVRQYKTALLQRLERENESTQKERKGRDAPVMENFYMQYYNNYIEVLKNATDRDDRARLEKAYQTAVVLFEVLNAVNLSEDVTKVNDEIWKRHSKVTEKSQRYVDNILPLDPESSRQFIMRYPEIEASLAALRNIRYLSWPEGHTKKVDKDILDWLQAIFGFQNDNVRNQREHLILLLANAHIRQPRQQKPDQQPMLDDRTVTEVMDKLFKNYNNWCKYLGRKASLKLPIIEREVLQRKLLYTGLHLLIWGEAANLRFMPECLCYIYHHMALQLCDVLDRIVTPSTRDNEAFLREVVTPIYNVIAKEARKSKDGRSEHSRWRNYDDLNEYFWSNSCFELGWPMHADADFFYIPVESTRAERSEEKASVRGDRWIGKINFVEIRTFWHMFRSYDRMWSFLVLCLQAMIIISWNGSGDIRGIFVRHVFRKVLSVFITAAALNLVQAVIDIIMSRKALKSIPFLEKLRYILKVVSAAAWAIVLPVTYASHPFGLTQNIGNSLGIYRGHQYFFFIAVLIYLSPNILSAIIFLFPSILRKLERSDQKIVRLVMWWSQPRLYVGRGMQESTFSVFTYTLFWVLLLAAKLAFSFYLEIKPLAEPTKEIMQIYVSRYRWHEFFPEAKHSIGVVIALWAPIIIVYFMDIQIWYTIFSTIIGGLYGAWSHLGEIRTLGMLRSRFQTIPVAFNACLFPAEKSGNPKVLRVGFSRKFPEIYNNKGKEEARFSQMWNKIIESFREEDLINNREMNLLLVPYGADRELKLFQWPPFLLACKLPLALSIAKDSKGDDHELNKRLNADVYMRSAIREGYASFKQIINCVVLGESERRVIADIFAIADHYIERGDLISRFDMTSLPILYDQLVRLIEYLIKNKEEDKDQVTIVLVVMLDLVTKDIMKEPVSSLVEANNLASSSRRRGMTPLDEQYHLFGNLHFPMVKNVEAWLEKLRNRLWPMDVPSNLDARRRISFFSNSLFMDMPAAPKVRNMLSFSILTPYYDEEVLFSIDSLEKPNDDGVSILFYLQNIFPDEWENFLERVGCSSEEDLKGNAELEEELRLWASYRGQTLTKTVRGMMYYRQALELQAFLDAANDEELMKGYNNATKPITKEQMRNENSTLNYCRTVADMKFTYVVSCQKYGIQKRAGDHRPTEILRLMTKYPSLRVAYIDELEDTSRVTVEKVYYSVLVKVAPETVDSSGLDQVIYKIKLPGPAILGEGKPENQNHAIIFTRGEGLQTIDMNQDNYMEEALKMRNLLQEFLQEHGARKPTILGLREHIFTGSVSSLAWFMSYQERSFVTIGQRILATPLKVRFHYGHPDVFDRLFHLTRGGVSKASKIINLSEDIFGGFNSTLRGGNITHHEYIQVGKGRDVGLNQISLFEAKIACGNGEQTVSRDIYRLGRRFDFFRMMSCYFTTVGSYFSTLLTVLTVYVFLYGRLYLVLSGLEEALSSRSAIRENGPLQVALASQSFVQIGSLMALPMLMEIGLEKGFFNAFNVFVVMQVRLAPLFFTFSLGTRAHYFGRTLLHGGARYRSTGRGFVVFHVKFADNYRLYSRSHFVKGLELMILLLVYQIFGQVHRGVAAYFFITMSMWFLAATWLFAPFLFNPSGFEWQKLIDDWTDWYKWIYSRGDIGVSPEKSWVSWWESEHEHLSYSGKLGRMFEILLSTRFFTYHYGLIYHLSFIKSQSIWVYGISWVVIIVVLLTMKIISVGGKRHGAEFQLAWRLFTTSIFLIFVVTLSILISVKHMSLQDVILCILAFIPTGWGLLLIAQALKPFVVWAGLWGSVRTIARVYEIIIGLVVLTPVTLLAWFPFVSEFQTRMLFNPAFSRGLQISRILGRPRTDRLYKNE